MSQFLNLKTSKASQRTPQRESSTNSTAKAVRFALKGGHSSVSDAFAHDKRMLDGVAKTCGDLAARNNGVMTGSLRRR